MNAEQTRLEEAREQKTAASHQMGWTGCVATMLQIFGLLDAKKLLGKGKSAAFEHTLGQRTGKGTGTP